jgi:hypothetical protein
MAFKFVLLCATLAAVNAGVVETGWQPNPWNQPTVYKQAAIVQQPTIIKQVQPALIKKVVAAEAPANYEFNYDVHDQQTGDIKRQHEVAKDGAISGQYSLIDADGYRRTVTYTADDYHGFQANVQREPAQHGWDNKQVITKVIQPAVTKVIQPATVTKVIAPAPSQGWQQPAWQAPTVLKVPAVSQGWTQPNPHAANPWG